MAEWEGGTIEQWPSDDDSAGWWRAGIGPHALQALGTRALFPKPAPSLAPWMMPAMSTNRTCLGTSAADLATAASLTSLASGTDTRAVLGSVTHGVDTKGGAHALPAPRWTMLPPPGADCEGRKRGHLGATARRWGAGGGGRR